MSSVLELRPGMRLSSVTCSAQVLVVGPAQGLLTCGGKPMVEGSTVPPAAAMQASPDPEADGTLLGKRYRSADGRCTVLCVRQGRGTLALDGVPLEIVKPKVLPASD